MIYLRPHHLLCIQRYIGHGYDEGFKTRMDDTIRMLKTDPDTEIVIVEGGDYLCSACPNYDGTSCLTNEKVRLMDDKVIRFCNADYGLKGNWADFYEKAAKVFGSEAFEDICGECEWVDICRTTIG